MLSLGEYKVLLSRSFASVKVEASNSADATKAAASAFVASCAASRLASAKLSSILNSFSLQPLHLLHQPRYNLFFFSQ